MATEELYCKIAIASPFAVNSNIEGLKIPVFANGGIGYGFSTR